MNCYTIPFLVGLALGAYGVAYVIDPILWWMVSQLVLRRLKRGAPK